MKAVITDEETLVYGSMEDQSISIATLHKGDAVELGKVIRKKNKVWVEATLSGDVKGYVDGETKIFAIKKGQLMSGSTDLLETPSTSGTVIKTITKSSVMEFNGVEKNDEGSWFSVIDETGTHGYVNANAKIRQIQEPSRSGATRNIIYGAVFIVLGVIFTLMNQKSDSASGMIYVSIAVIFFGLLQGGQGVIELIKVNKMGKTQQK